MDIKKMMLSGFVFMGVLSSNAAIRYVSQSSASPVSPYTTWATAAVDLQDAIDVSGTGDRVVVSNGVYSHVGGFYVDEAIHIESLNGASSTFLDGQGNFECISLADPGCSISGFTIQNGSNHRGGGVYSLYANAVVSNCVIRSCSASIGGGGVYQGTLYNCEISGNESADLGGGTYDAELNHCTVTGNEAQSGAGGVYDGTANNCIIWGNSSPGYWKDMASVTANYSCSPDLTHGSNGNITNAPILVSSSHIATNSPCRGAGSAVYSVGVDIDGESWISPPSMGCDENAGAGNIFGAIFLSVSGPTSVVTNIEVAYAAQIDGPLTAALLQIGNQPAVTNPAGPVLHVWPTDGAEQIILTAFSDSYPAGLSFTQSVQIVSLAASAVHVSDASGNDGNDGSTWALAKKTIQAGVDAQSIYRGLVLVSNGTYSAAARIDIAKDLFVQGMEGDLATIIDGPGGVSLNSSRTVFSGFTVQNAQYGGIHCFNTVPVITNCVIRDNANSYGGGVYRGTVVDCVVSNNNAYTPGLGGGLHESIIYNSLIISNTANAGGGVDKCTAYNSTIVGNTVNSEAGGALNSTLNNCLVVGNTAYRGGGTFFGTANNCTVVGNHATDSAGGMYRGIVNNTIVRDNISDINLGNNTYTPSAADLDYFRNTCSSDLTHGVNGNITNAPNFVNAAAGNYRLNNNSPCIDAGTNTYVVGGVDLAGRERIRYGVVDMGAYEWLYIPSPIENLAVAQRPGTKLVDLYFDLTTNATLSLVITNEGAGIAVSSLSGDAGSGITTGLMKHAIWDAGADWDGNSATLQYTLSAENGIGEQLDAKTVTSSTDSRDYLLTVSSTHSSKTIVPGSALDIRIDLGDQSPAPGGNWNTIGTASFSTGSPITLKDHATGLTSHGVTIRDGSGSQNAPLTMSSVWNSNASKDWVKPSAVADQLLSLGAHFFAVEGLDPMKTYRMELLAASDVDTGEVQTHFIIDTVLGNPIRGNGWAPNTTINSTPSGTGSQVDSYELYTDGWAAANWLVWEDVVPGRHGYEVQGYGSDAVLFTLSNASVGFLNAMRISEVSSPSVITQNIAIASGSVSPGVGTHAYAWNSTVTASVGSVVSVGGTNYTSTGWLGTGSVPVLGNTQNTGGVTLTELASSIDWRWIMDADADLIPDDWEQLYFGSETGAVATADTDGDGYSTWQEYILGSNPTNGGSSFLFTPGTNPPPGEFSVDFTTVPGRLYTVECTDELGSGNWQVLTNFIGDGSTSQIIDPANIPACFYQIRIDWVE